MIRDHEANKAASFGPGFLIVIWYAGSEVCPLADTAARGGLRLGNVSKYGTGARLARINITDNVPTEHQE